MVVSRFLLLTSERMQIPSDNTEQQCVEDAAEAEEERADRENGRRTQVSHPGKTTDRAEQGAETGSAGWNTNFEEKP